jgi:hypothetical protein
MEALTCREVQALEAFEVQAVVDVPAIRGTAAFRDESLVPQASKMVGDEVVGLTHKSNELLDPAVTPGQSLNQTPPQLVRQELQERRRIDQRCGRHCGNLF